MRHLDSLALTKYTPGSQLPVWPKPGNEPPIDVDRAVFVAIHHQVAVLVFAAIRPLPERHVLQAFADMTHPGGIALINYIQFFPKAQTLVLEHLHEANAFIRTAQEKPL